MKKILTILLCSIVWSASAQVEKMVEVTKTYTPSVESASKLVIEPDMTDTVKMRPEIDYTITPVSMQTALEVRPIRPATVTYWEFNRPLPFYLKAGLGYPLNSVVDFYASTQNPGTGYLLGYFNHEGRYSKIINDFDIKNRSTQMLNRAGVAAGKYLGKRTLEGELSYDNRLYHRFGEYDYVVPREDIRVNFGEAALNLRFGDDFTDLSRFNFEIAASGAFFADYANETDFGKAQQLDLGAHLKIGKAFGKHRFTLEGGYEKFDGKKAISKYGQQYIRAALRYGLDNKAIRVEAGVDYYNDRVKDASTENYILPFLRLNINTNRAGLTPFIEMDGSVRNNGYRSLVYQNPYLTNPHPLDKSSVNYNGRAGIGGTIGKNKFTYRLYAGFSVQDNYLYWEAQTQYYPDMESVRSLFAALGRQSVISFNGEATYRPLQNLRFDAAIHGYLYRDEYGGRREVVLYNGAPDFEGNMGIQYSTRKISLGAGIWVQGERRWALHNIILSYGPEPDLLADVEYSASTITAPLAVDLRFNFDWRIRPDMVLFVEGRNLLNRRLYEFAWYPQYGANFTVGVKIAF